LNNPPAQTTVTLYRMYREDRRYSRTPFGDASWEREVWDCGAVGCAGRERAKTSSHSTGMRAGLFSEAMMSCEAQSVRLKRDDVYMPVCCTRARKSTALLAAAHNRRHITDADTHIQIHDVLTRTCVRTQRLSPASMHCAPQTCASSANTRHTHTHTHTHTQKNSLAQKEYTCT